MLQSRKAGILIRIILLVLLVYMVFLFVHVRQQITDTKEEIRTLTEEVADQTQTNTELTNAIENAKNTFKSATAAAVVQAGIDALKNAVTAFKEGTGDLTGLGTNMSFEDLSAQGGGETSSVAAPPYGWNMYINGRKIMLHRTTTLRVRPRTE